MHVYTHMHTHACIHTHAHTHACMMHTPTPHNTHGMHTYAHTHTHIHTYMHTYKHTNIHAHTHIVVHMHMHTPHVRDQLTKLSCILIAGQNVTEGILLPRNHSRELARIYACTVQVELSISQKFSEGKIKIWTSR